MSTRVFEQKGMWAHPPAPSRVRLVRAGVRGPALTNLTGRPGGGGGGGGGGDGLDPQRHTLKAFKTVFRMLMAVNGPQRHA